MSKSKVRTRLWGPLWFCPALLGFILPGRKGASSTSFALYEPGPPTAATLSEAKVQSYGNLKEKTPNCTPALEGAPWGASHASHRNQIIK